MSHFLLLFIYFTYYRHKIRTIYVCMQFKEDKIRRSVLIKKNHIQSCLHQDQDQKHNAQFQTYSETLFKISQVKKSYLEYKWLVKRARIVPFMHMDKMRSRWSQEPFLF